MVKKMCGNFEVDTTEGWARIEYSENEYEYVVNPMNYSKKKDAILASKAFVKGYEISKDTMRRRLKDLLNL